MQYVLSVSEINKYIKEVISKDLILSNLWVKGEISNFKLHYSGHMYFTIKDESSVLKCVFFKNSASQLKFTPENGLRVIIKGYISVFERDGQYQLYCEEMQPDGIGSLHIAYEQLKKKLQDEGLFDPANKKKLPFLPRRIGVVTSRTGAVIRDIINVIGRRYNNARIIIFPAAVQGEPAPGQISHAINRFNELQCVDVIIVARGGGSIEELWAFNEEIVARSIYNSKIPVISAVGHETDYTIADFAADVRAPTPSAAAELVLPEKGLLAERISSLQSRLKSSLLKNCNINRSRLEKLLGSTAFKKPYDRVFKERMRLDVLDKYAVKALDIRLEKTKKRLGILVGKLDSLSPLAILSRGYSIVKKKKDSGFVKSIETVTYGDEIEITVADGKINGVVTGTG